MSLQDLWKKFAEDDIDPKSVEEFIELVLGHMHDNPTHQLHIWFGSWSGADDPKPGLNVYCKGGHEEPCEWWNQVLI
jgi:hypothetical protein